MKSIARSTLFALAFQFVAGHSIAQSYPTKSIQIVIGYPPGTILDATVRIAMPEMEKALGQTIVLEFKPGANGTIGAKAVANAAPDGYTLLYGNPLSIHPYLNKNNAVNAATELAPISNFTVSPFFLFSSAKLPATTFKELLAYARANPDKLNHAATSPNIDLMMLMLKEKTGLESRSIPYRAPPQLIPDLISGEIGLSLASLQTYIPHLQKGTIRALFVGGPTRDPLAPEVPTSAEAGIPNYLIQLYYGLWAPARTPTEITRKLSAAAATAIRVPAVNEQIRKALAANPVGSTPEEQLRTFEADVKFWTDAARLANFQPQ